MKQKPAIRYSFNLPNAALYTCGKRSLTTLDAELMKKESVNRLFSKIIF